MPPPTHRTPPLVRATVGGEALHAYLLGWVGGRARITWVEAYHDEPHQWRWVETTLPSGDVEQLPGQSYLAVPKE
ncbi:hypothetical protein [Nocardiopsis tropica]|uniref:Uncharacterized protein n=1 Tax=Nocardiopsis tropica TaxID=109330 RepID=A0ABU7KZG2_9ACTN|nr:hypothetical protein [Nocardiopsis umidischolae]MEE2054664.1 hypothetical protein [Nocardiopsis umidischolae]